MKRLVLLIAGLLLCVAASAQQMHIDEVSVDTRFTFHQEPAPEAGVFRISTMIVTCSRPLRCNNAVNNSEDGRFFLFFSLFVH